MNVHQIERTAVLGLGFVGGAALAMCIAPGDIFLWIATGIVLGLFSRAFFINGFGSEWSWPFAQSRHSHKKRGTDQNRP
jgi:hypothetical protein